MKQEETSWAFDSEDLQGVSELLAGYLSECRARSAYLVDRSGQLLDRSGETKEVDDASFASLAAADFAASGQLATLLGEEEFASLYHQGESRSMVLADVGGRAIFATLFDASTTLGLVRLKTLALVPKLAEIMETAARKQKERPRSGLVESGWADEAAGEIDKLFTD